uniref:Solute carrier family 13 member 2 n=1 Tax=Rousettus aegyptiacus TaxID=9407 RepID=A0A7J8GGX1_ROUAE|nr:hypothetical protein HJG63_017673 [Rousettus aegyptiacus]
MATCWQVLWAYRSYLIVFALPILLLPLPILVATKEAYCAYTIILMAFFWCTEALPLAVTALLPIILFPMMGIMKSSEVCIQYFNDTNVLFFGGLLVAIAVEHRNLHKRIALRVLLIIGVRPALLMLGFMLVTAFLSMWISNTASTAMMMPIAHAVLQQLSKSSRDRDIEEGRNNPTFGLQEISDKNKVTKHENRQIHPLPPGSLESKTNRIQKKYKFSQGMSLCVCYSASIGGLATLTGTGPNLVLQGQVNSLFPNNVNVVNFASWFGFAFPVTVIFLLLTWIWLQILFLGFNFRRNFGIEGQMQEQGRAGLEVIQREHRQLGPMTFAEKAVAVLFVLLVLLWFTRKPGFYPGWGKLAFSDAKGKSLVSDGTVAIFVGMIMFIMPSKIPGLTQDPAAFTECTSNVATASLFLPILASIVSELALTTHLPQAALLPTPTQEPCLWAQGICLHPLYVMVPCTLSASLAFMLPVATPPNAISFSFGGLRVSDMARAGFMLNIIGVLVVMLAINSWAFPIFNLYTFPSWAHSNSSTHCVSSESNTTLSNL